MVDIAPIHERLRAIYAELTDIEQAVLASAQRVGSKGTWEALEEVGRARRSTFAAAGVLELIHQPEVEPE